MEQALESEFFVGKNLMETGDYAEAIGHFTAALAEDSDVFLTALNHRGYCYLMVSEEDWALKDFARAIATDPKFNTNMYILAAVCCKRNEEYVTAARYLSRGLQVFPQFSELQMARAEVFLKLSKFEKAMLDLKQILHIHPQHPRALCRLGDTYRGLGAYNEALVQYSEAIAVARKRIALMDFGEQPDALKSSKDVDELCADDLLKQRSKDLVQMTPESTTLRDELVQCLFRRALLHRLLGNLDLAGTDFMDIVAFDNDPRASFWYAMILVEQGSIWQACHFLEAMEENDTMLAERRTLLAAILMQRTPCKDRDFAAALSHLKKACDKNASKAVHMTKLICQAADTLRHDPRKALALLDKVAAPRKRISASGGHVRPSLHSARETDAHVEARQVSEKRDLVAKGNDLEAALECRTYLDLLVRDGEPTLVHELRTCAYIKLSMWDDAAHSARHVSACSSTAPDSSEFNRNIAIGMLKEDLDTAISHFSKSILLFPRPYARIHRAVCLCHLAYSKDSSNRIRLLQDALKEVRLILREESSSPADVLAAQCIQTIGAYCLQDFAVAWSAYEAVKARSGEEICPAFSELDIVGAEICAMQGRTDECEVLCAKLIETRSTDLCLVCPYATRAKCLLKVRLIDGINDLKSAIHLALDPLNVQLLLGDAYFAARRYREACAAYEDCYRRRAIARVTYSLARVNLKMGKVKAALMYAFETAQLHPTSGPVQVTKDGLLCLQDMLLANFQKAQIRWTSILVKNQQVTKDEPFPPVFSVYEMLQYRGVCSLYMDYPQKALQDFDTAIESLHLLYEAASNYEPLESLAPEVCVHEEMINFEANLRYNMAICDLFIGNFVKATEILMGLLSLFDKKPIVHRACLWFLLGLCQLAQQKVDSRESFMRSYALDCRWVDDFLTTHAPPASARYPSRSQTPRYDSGLSPVLASRPSTAGTGVRIRSAGNASARGHEGPQPLTISTGKNRLGARLDGKKARLRDIVLSIRPVCDWPFVSPPNLEPTVDWAMLSLSSHGFVQTEPIYPWE